MEMLMQIENKDSRQNCVKAKRDATLYVKSRKMGIGIIIIDERGMVVCYGNVEQSTSYSRKFCTEENRVILEVDA